MVVEERRWLVLRGRGMKRGQGLLDSWPLATNGRMFLFRLTRFGRRVASGRRKSKHKSSSAWTSFFPIFSHFFFIFFFIFFHFSRAGHLEKVLVVREMAG